MSDFVVAYWVPHNEGLVLGVIDGANQDTGTDLVDLYEVDATIRSFASRAEADAWLALKEREWNDGPDLDREETYGMKPTRHEVREMPE